MTKLELEGTSQVRVPTGSDHPDPAALTGVRKAQNQSAIKDGNTLVKVLMMVDTVR